MVLTTTAHLSISDSICLSFSSRDLLHFVSSSSKFLYNNLILDTTVAILFLTAENYLRSISSILIILKVLFSSFAFLLPTILQIVIIIYMIYFIYYSFFQII